MQKITFIEIINRNLIYIFPGYLYFFYILFPFRFWESFVFANQTETLVISVFFGSVFLLFTLPRIYKTSDFQLNKIDLCLVIYAVYLLFRLKYPVEKEYLFLIFSCVCIYLYFRNFPEKYLKGLIILIPVTCIIQIADGIKRFSMPWDNISHITGTFYNTGLFGGFVALGFVICIGLFLTCLKRTRITQMTRIYTDNNCLFFKKIKICDNLRYPRYLCSKIITGLIFILSLVLAVQVYASGSRASWMATLSAIFLLLFRFVPIKWKIKPNRRWLRYVLILCLLVISMIFLKYLYGIKKDSADGRLLIARVSLEMVKDAPVLGSGISGFKTDYLNYQADYFRTHPDSPYSMIADDVQTPFNEFLKILIEQGIAGLILFFFLLYYLFKNEKSAIIQSIIIFILIFGLFSYPFEKLPFVVLFIFALAILSQTQKPIFTINTRKIRYWRIPFLLVFCLASTIIAGKAYNYSQSCLAWNRSLKHLAFDREESLSQLQKLYPILENNPIFLTTYGKILSFSGNYREAVTILEKAVKQQPLSSSYIELGKVYEATGFSEKALTCWEHAGQIVPSRFTPLYLTMKLHFKSGEYDIAQEYAEQLLAKKVKIDNLETDAMKREAHEILNF